ncbi:MAG: 50S ribosomal protein L2 [Candidatus Magasanikbacteria bacterium]|nr:50S ribosomal protein L2 [Candidatus Magasanikbacteria bacterium]
MPVKIYKPTTPGRRQASVQDFSDITKRTPEKSLVQKLKSRSGRNNTGKITVRHRGGGVKRLYRIVDFQRKKYDVSATVEAIEYDPNRGPRLALLKYADGERAYILAPQGVRPGDVVMSSLGKIDPTPGARMPLAHIPVGLFIHDIELTPGGGGQIVRSAGNGGQLQVIEGDYAQVKLPSGEVRLIQKTCSASIGMVSNPDLKLVRLGKAGRKRKLGWRPTVLGKSMNPVDHPHGGGEGHSPIGLKGGPKTPWGKKALGVKTRKSKKWSDKFIISRRARRTES